MFAGYTSKATYFKSLFKVALDNVTKLTLLNSNIRSPQKCMLGEMSEKLCGEVG